MPNSSRARIWTYLRMALPFVALGIVVGLGIIGIQQFAEKQREAEATGHESRSLGESPAAKAAAAEAPDDAQPRLPRAQMGPPISFEEAMSHGSLEWLLEEDIISLADLEAYLEQHQHSTGALIAVWQITGDQKYLQEAIKRRRDDPLAWFAVANSGVITEHNCAAMLADYQEAMPDQALPDYLMAAQLARQDNYAAALELLRQASEKPLDVRSLGDAQMQATRDLLEHFGQEPGPAALMAFQNRPMNYLTEVMGLSRSVLDSVGDEQTSVSQRVEALELLYGIGERIKGTDAGSTAIEQLAARSLQTGSLSLLAVLAPEESSISDPRKRMEELMDLKDETVALQEDFMDRHPLPGDAYETYMQILMENGEFAAMEWAVENYQPLPVRQ